MGGGACAEIFLAPPVFQIVTAFIACFGKVGYFILPEAIFRKHIYCHKIDVRRFVIVRRSAYQLGTARKGSVLLDFQHIGRNVGNIPQAS